MKPPATSKDPLVIYPDLGANLLSLVSLVNWKNVLLTVFSPDSSFSSCDAEAERSDISTVSSLYIKSPLRYSENSLPSLRAPPCLSSSYA